VSLLTVGGLSDHVGRRPLLAAALLGDAAAMAVFLAADGVGWLVAARVVQGLATGAGLGVISAYLVDLQPPANTTLGALLNSVGSSVGLALGSLGAGLVLQLVPHHPTTWVFALLAAVLVLGAAAVPALPETVDRRPGALASLRPRVAVPHQARAAFRRAVPALLATWAMGGLYLALGPSLAAGVLHARSHLVGGLVVTALMTTAGIASAAVRSARPARMMSGGAAVLAVGTTATLVALDAGSLAGFLAASAVAGLGFGAAFLGVIRSLSALARPHERAGLFASLFVVSYLAFSLPAVVAGVEVERFGLRGTATAYGAGIVALALMAAVLGHRTERADRRRVRDVPGTCCARASS
jgi:MFS family permease